MHRTAALPLFTTMLECGHRRFFRSERPCIPTSGDANKTICVRLSGPSRPVDEGCHGQHIVFGRRRLKLIVRRDVPDGGTANNQLCASGGTSVI